MFTFLAAKYQEHRDMLNEEFLTARGGHGDAVTDAYRILQRSCQRLSAVSLSAALLRNVGRKNSFHGGLVPLLCQGLRVMRKAPPRSSLTTPSSWANSGSGMRGSR